MTIQAPRALFVALASVLVLSSPSFAASRPAPAAGALDVGSIMGDPMSPVNPYNSGTGPVTMPNDARIVVFNYSRDQIFRIMTAPAKNTTIEFAPGEKLVAEPAMGDSVSWIIDTDGANHVFIKPVRPGLVNTLHLTTNLRDYDMTLVSWPMGGLFYQSVRFHYAESLMAKVRARGRRWGCGWRGLRKQWRDRLRASRRLSRQAQFRLQGRRFHSVPAGDGLRRRPVRLVAAAAGGAVRGARRQGPRRRCQPELHPRGQYIVVQQMVDRIVLRAGDDEVTVTRRRPGIFGF